MTCHLDDCTVMFAAYCPACKWTGDEYDDIHRAAHDCIEHNRKRRHIQGHKGYAHVRTQHHHEPAIPA